MNYLIKLLNTLPGDSLILLGIVFILLLTTIMAAIAWFEYKKGWTALLLTGMIQIAAYYWLLEYGFSGLGDAAYFGAGFALLMAAPVFAGTIGLLTYPLLFLIIYKPVNWGKIVKRILIIYASIIAVAIVLLFLTAITKMSFVRLYGKVIDDRGPVAGASIHLRGCPYFSDNPALTNPKGIFHISAICKSTFSLIRIHNPSNNSNCVSNFKEKSGRSDILMIFDSYDKGRKSGRPHWVEYDIENPFIFSCAWHNPENIIEKRTQSKRVIPDGRVYTLIAPKQSSGGLIEGDNDGLIKFQLYLEPVKNKASRTPRNGWLKLSAIKGGVQEKARNDYLNIAPSEGYHKESITEFKNKERRIRKKYYFHANDKNLYGVIDVSVYFNNREKYWGSQFNLRYTVNYDGERALDTHDMYRLYSNKDEILK